MQLKSDETILQGFWIDLGSALTEDANWERINRLVAESLEHLATSDNGTDKLYRDPGDGRFWELTPVMPGLKNGGPPLLKVIEPERAKEKYPRAFTAVQ